MKNIKLITLAITAVSAVVVSQVALADGNKSKHSRGHRQSSETNFVRMFPNLPAFAPQNDETRAAAAQIGAISGVMDAADDLSDPLQSIINQPEFSPNNLDNPDMTAGLTFVGQFLDHDVTLDNRSPIDETADPENAVNERTAAFDMDSVYGGGPRRSPQLYVRTDAGIKFIVETIPGSESVSRGGVPRFDLPRDENGVAIMGDGRNDENTIVSQWHLAMMMFHNAVTDDIMSDESAAIMSTRQVFTEAQRVVQWHYQWIIMNEFLPLTIGQDRVDTIMREGLKFYQPISGVAAECSSFDNLSIQNASSDFPFDDDYSPSRAIDDNLNTESRWSSNGVGNSIVLDLGENRTVRSLNTAWFRANIRTAFFDVETSTNRNDWQNVASQATVSGTEGLVDIDVTDSVARYVRIVGQGNSSSSNWNSLIEVNVFGCNDTTTQQASSPRLPIEFAGAAYRFGHSQVRPSYRMNFGSDADTQVFSFILDIRIDPNDLDPDDLRGGRRAPRRFIDWQTFFDFGDGNVRQNKLIDTKITSNLFELPGQVAPSPGLPADGPLSLLSRNLIRHVNFGLPSGQDIAREMGFTPLAANQLSELASANMDESTPLWYYVLKEAELLEEGRRLGPVGAGIVGEVFIGLLQADSDSYVAVEPNWTPTLPSSSGPGNFRIVDLLEYAGVVTPLE